MRTNAEAGGSCGGAGSTKLGVRRGTRGQQAQAGGFGKKQNQNYKEGVRSSSFSHCPSLPPSPPSVRPSVLLQPHLHGQCGAMPANAMEFSMADDGDDGGIIIMAWMMAYDMLMK